MQMWMRTGVLLLASLLLEACSLGYYWQAATGQMDLLRRREPVSELLADPATDPRLRERLQQVRQMLDFAHAELSLPDNGSYRLYVEIDRAYVVWNVFAAPELSVELRRWCYPVAGCVAYRGYFRHQAARDYADRLAAEGNDVFVGGVPAYSTLGRFRDPLLNTMLDLPVQQLAGLLFHELAHQALYLRGDTVFNESFATAVELDGVDRWLAVQGDRAGRARFHLWHERRAAVQQLMQSARGRLQSLYASDLDAAGKRQRKAGIFEALRADYQRLRAGWSSPPYFDGWFGDSLNNASLGAMATYEEYVPAFRALLRASDGNFARFLEQARALSKLDAATRRERLDVLASAG